MKEMTVFPRDLCVGDIVLGLQDRIERVVDDVWYTTGFPAQWNGKIYQGGYSIDFTDREWLIHAYDRPLNIKRSLIGKKKPRSAVSIFYRWDIPKKKDMTPRRAIPGVR